MSEQRENISSTRWSKVVLAAVMVTLVSLLAYCHHCLNTQHRFLYPGHQILMVQMIAVTNAQQSSFVVSHTLLPEDWSKLPSILLPAATVGA